MKSTFKKIFNAALFGAVIAVGGLAAKSALATGDCVCLGGRCCTPSVCCDAGGSGYCWKKAF